MFLVPIPVHVDLICLFSHILLAIDKSKGRSPGFAHM